MTAASLLLAHTGPIWVNIIFVLHQVVVLCFLGEDHLSMVPTCRHSILKPFSGLEADWCKFESLAMFNGPSLSLRKESSLSEMCCLVIGMVLLCRRWFN